MNLFISIDGDSEVTWFTLEIPNVYVSYENFQDPYNNSVEMLICDQH
jgi:hypothetical protein